MANNLKITYIRSALAHDHRQRKTVQALGLRRLHQTVIKQDNPCIRGMIKKVPHLLQVEENNN
jgi:large subunit ribosomal protein L30